MSRRAAEVAWIDEHVERTGEVELVRARPWATVLRAPTAGGTVWMKAAGSGTAFEVPLYRVLAREVPERVLTPIASDVERAWLLLPDGGPSLGEQGARATRWWRHWWSTGACSAGSSRSSTRCWRSASPTCARR